MLIDALGAIATGVAIFVVGLGCMFLFDKGREYNFLDMDDGRDDDEQS